MMANQTLWTQDTSDPGHFGTLGVIFRPQGQKIAYMCQVALFSVPTDGNVSHM